MNKTEFVAAVASKAGVSQAKAAEYVGVMLDLISNSLKAGEKVTLTGFGSFEVRARAGRTVTDIRTKEKRAIPASRLPAFTAGSVLKEAVHPKVKVEKAAPAPATKPAKASKPKAKKGKAA